MKKISNLTQTYGNLRYEEIDYFLSDKNVEILNKLDIITFSFHNSNDEFKKINTEKILKKIPNCIIYYFDDINYVDSIILYLNNLKKLGMTDFLLWQDDHYMNDNKKSELLFTELLLFYKNNEEINYLSLFFDTFYNFDKFIKFESVKNVKNNLNIYKYDTYDIRLIQLNNFTIYTYSDENYIMNIELALNNFFLDEYKELSVWELEVFLCEKIAELHIKRWLTNAILFYRRSIHSLDSNNINGNILMYVNRQNDKSIENINNSLL